MSLTIKPPGYQMRKRADKIFTALQSAVPKPERRAAHHNFCIAEDTWRLIDERVSVRQEPGRCQLKLRSMGRAIHAALKSDRRRRVEMAGDNVEQLLIGDPPLLREAWKRMRGGCRTVVDHAPLPARVTLKRIMVKHA